MDSFRDGQVFADLAPLTDPLLLSSFIASLLGVAVQSENPVPSLLAFLGDKEILVILDSCEHLLEPTARLAEDLLKGTSRLHILATSREPLRAAGEFVWRLPPLEVPPSTDPVTAEVALGFSAVQLFVERVKAHAGQFELSDKEAPLASEICRKLDGNALAIELAAGRVDAFGISGVASRLVDQFSLLRGGRRTALPRHQTLVATLDWSYDLLSPGEQAVLRRLSVFAGSFTLDAAATVAGDGAIGGSEAIEGVASLVAKSLISAQSTGRMRYRLLDTTRAYARQKLIDDSDLDSCSRRHAEFFKRFFEQTAIDYAARNAADWILAFADQADNVRAALDWCCSKSGDARIGVALTIATVPLWLNLSLMDECRQRVQRALSRLGEGKRQASLQEMQLYTALGVALYSIGPSPASTEAWRRVRQMANRLRNTDHALRALWGLWTVQVIGFGQKAGLSLAHEFSGLAAEAVDPEATLVGDRLVGISQHFLGNQSEARLYIERMLQQSPWRSNPSDIIRFQFDQPIASRSYLAKVLWLQGYPGQAFSAAERGVRDAQAIGHALSLCYTLGSGACPLALLAGDIGAAQRYVSMLLDHAVKHRLALWITMGKGFKGALLLRLGDYAQGIRLLREAIDDLRNSGFVLYRTAFLGELAEGLGRSGETAAALKAAGDALMQSSEHEEQWCKPELLRIFGELVLLDGCEGAHGRAEACFAEALDLARRQGALSWELRTAISFARLRRAQNRSRDARQLLAPIYAAFPDGLETADIRSVRQLLHNLD